MDQYSTRMMITKAWMHAFMFMFINTNEHDVVSMHTYSRSLTIICFFIKYSKQLLLNIYIILQVFFF